MARQKNNGKSNGSYPKGNFILANPPFDMSDWGGENLRQDVRWKFGMPPVNNANYAGLKCDKDVHA